jgi:HPt (histidine-containing phosphotransfer) domain-containing protein
MSDDSGVRARIADLVGDGGPGAVQLVGRIVASFLDRAPGLIDKLAAAVDAADAAGAVHWAHALTGAAGNLGVTEVARIAAEAEQHAAEGALDRVASCRADLDAALALARVELATILDELAASATSR